MIELDQFCRTQFSIFHLDPINPLYEQQFVLSSFKSQSGEGVHNFEYESEKVVSNKFLLTDFRLSSVIDMKMVSFLLRKVTSLTNNHDLGNDIRAGHLLMPFFEKNISGSP